MKITVIVPVYNCAPYLSACLDSILSQTYASLEILLIDDGSTDDSPAICDAYAQKDSRIMVIHQSNQGVSAARNAGLDAATGDWIGFVDADDTIEPDMYEVLADLLLTHAADIAVCGYKKVYFDGSYKEILGTKEKVELTGPEACHCILTGRLFTGSPCSKLYRRGLFQQIRFDPSLKINEDILMNIQVLQLCEKIVFLDVCKYNYFERPQSATRVTNALKIKQDCVAAAEKMLSIFQDSALAEVCSWRMRYALIDLYRTGLLQSPASTNQERDEIHNRYRSLRRRSRSDLRMTLNYQFMRHLPRTYVMVYRTYQKLHKQDNDI